MDIKEHMEVIGADGVHVGTVDKVEGDRIKLTKKDSGEGSHKGHHHFIDNGLFAGIEGNKVRLSTNGNVAVTMEEAPGSVGTANLRHKASWSVIAFRRQVAVTDNT
jgi:hypothetical protein